MPWGDTKTVEEAMRYVDFDSMIFTYIDDERKDIRNETIKYSVRRQKRTEVSWMLEIPRETYETWEKPQKITGEKILSLMKKYPI